MKVVKFKPPHTRIKFTNGDPDLNTQNLTYERYEKLIARNPNYRTLFEVTDLDFGKADKKK